MTTWSRASASFSLGTALTLMALVMYDRHHNAETLVDTAASEPRAADLRNGENGETGTENGSATGPSAAAPRGADSGVWARNSTRTAVHARVDASTGHRPHRGGLRSPPALGQDCRSLNSGALLEQLRAARVELCERASILAVQWSRSGRKATPIAEGVISVHGARIPRASLRQRNRRGVSVHAPCGRFAARLTIPKHMYQRHGWLLVPAGSASAQACPTNRSSSPRAEDAAAPPPPPTTHVLFAHDGERNVFHAVSAVVGAYLSTLAAGVDPASATLLVTDDVVRRTDLSTVLLRALFQRVLPLGHASTPECFGQLLVPYRHLAITWRDFHKPMARRCAPSSLLAGFRDAVVRGLGLPMDGELPTPVTPRADSPAGAPAPRPARVLLLLRTAKSYRRILNPEAIQDAFEYPSRGWQSGGSPPAVAPRAQTRTPPGRNGSEAAAAAHVRAVDLGELSVVEQLKLVRGADVLVGVHGAALTWLLFARAGTTVLELVPPRSGPFCYYNLAHLAGHRACRYRTEELRRNADDNVHVHPPLLDAFLRLCFDTPAPPPPPPACTRRALGDGCAQSSSSTTTDAAGLDLAPVASRGVSTDPYFMERDPFRVVPYSQLLGRLDVAERRRRRRHRALQLRF